MIAVLFSWAAIQIQIQTYCQKIYPQYQEDCQEYLEDCIGDGESQKWCEEDYNHYIECLKDENKCR